MTTLHNLDGLINIVIPFQGRQQQVVLQVPASGELLPLLLEPQFRTPQRLGILFPAELKRLIKTIDNRQMDIETARALYTESQAVGMVLAARNKLFEALSEQGLVYAQCPHCRSWEAEITVLGLTVGLHAGPWPIIDEGLYLAMPSLCDPRDPGGRPAGCAPASRIRFTLPTSQVGIPSLASGGILGSADAEKGAREAAALSRWAPENKELPAGREQWRRDVPGFRALLRLCVALNTLDGIADIDPETLSALPIIDFYFLDNLHYLVHNVNIPASSPALIPCPECGGKFMPVL